MNRQELKKWASNNLYRQDGWFDGNRSNEKWYIKNDKKDIYNSLVEFQNTNNLTKIAEVAYWLKYDITETPTCQICNKPLRFYGRKGYTTICGNGNCKATYHEQVMMGKYGTTNYAKTNEFKALMISKRKSIEEKKKATCLKKYGVDNVMKAEINKKKLASSMIEKYGVKTNLLCLSDESKLKRTNTFASSEYRNKLSHLRYTESEDIKQSRLSKTHKKLIEEHGSIKNAYKIRELVKQRTFLKKYGVSNPQQNTEIHEKTQKSRYKFKDFEMPSGKIVQVQGYEHKALNHIIENKIYSENQIEIQRSKMPTIWYSKNSTQKHRYYPDIFIEHENKIIEVKSDYTVLSNLEVNYLKREACIKEGFIFEFWIYSDDKLYII